MSFVEVSLKKNKRNCFKNMNNLLFLYLKYKD